jgi:ribosomal protein S18 acetylase RimI-like enzyme
MKIPSYQSKGVVKKMVNYVLRYLQDNNINIINTGTQLRSVNALNLYIRNGFLIQKSKTLLHRWGGNL